MEVTPNVLDPYLQKLVNTGISGIDIMHGHLKVLMLEAEGELTLAKQYEADSEEAMDSMERRYWEGQCDALAHLYSLTYDISFAIAAKEGTEMNHEHNWDTPSDKSLVAECACGEQIERVQD